MIRRLGIGCVLVVALAMPAGATAKVSRGEVKTAAKHCKALRAQMGTVAFRAQFGANQNKRNAFGRCVAKYARGEHRAAKKALRECKAEYAADPVAFLEEYGTEPAADAAFERPGQGAEGERPAKPEGEFPGEARPEKPERPNGADAALRRAMHKCVALKLRELKAERREALESAVESCKEEYLTDPAAFLEKYSPADAPPEASNLVAFGKCVLSKVKSS